MTEPGHSSAAPFADRVAVVTGGTRGIGRATAQALSDWGATVVITGRDPDRAKEVAAELGPSASGIGLDVRDFDAVGAAFRAIAEEHGRIDAAVANAGAMDDALPGMIKSEHVRELLDVNVLGTVATVQAAARAMMRRRTGSVVLLASVVGERGAAGQTAYAAAKAAIAAVARSAAKELGPRGIRVNAVAPGMIATDLIAHLPADLVERRVGESALRRLGSPTDVATAIRFLLSDDAAFITGQVVGVDGGLVV